MKNYASFCRSNLVSIITAVVCIGIPLSLAAEDVALPNGSPAAAVTAPPAPGATFTPQAPALPTGVSDVVKMYQGGISKDVLVNYIDNSVLSFHLNADGIIYLQHLGLPQEVTSTMLRRDGELQKMAGAAYQQQQQQAAFAAANSQPVPAPAAVSPPPVVVPGTPAPVAPYAYAPDAAPPVVYPDYSAYPYYGYGYPYYYGPNVIVGGGWGWGWGHGFGWGGRGFDHGGFGHGGFGGGHGGHR